MRPCGCQSNTVALTWTKTMIAAFFVGLCCCCFISLSFSVTWNQHGIYFISTPTPCHLSQSSKASDPRDMIEVLLFSRLLCHVLVIFFQLFCPCDILCKLILVRVASCLDGLSLTKTKDIGFIKKFYPTQAWLGFG